jgi:hypothetical protein
MSTFLRDLKELVRDITGIRATEDYADPNESELQAVGGPVPSKDVMEERPRPQSLIGHEATVHVEIV